MDTDIAVERQAARKPLTLREMDFTDLYISEVGETLIRGLKDVDGPLIDVPDGAIADLSALHRVVLSMAQNESDSFSFDFDGVRYRATQIDAQQGVWYTLRKLVFPIPRLRSLNVHPVVYRELGRLGKRPNSGLILVAGATGNGKTTSVSSLLQEYLLTYGDMAITIEDPPELKLEGTYGAHGHCLQKKVKEGDFAKPLRDVLRQNPRYIMLGEIRDPAAAAQVVRAAISGHVVLATIHGGSISEAITSLMNYVSKDLGENLARQNIADGLAVVLHQELRTIAASDGRTQRIPIITSLFVKGDMGIRAKLRSGNVQLDTEIERQAALVRDDKSPIGNK